jgi:two-component SAPR family response regulator
MDFSKEENRKKFEEVVRPVMEFLADVNEFHPHVKIIINSIHAELVEGVTTFNTEDYLVD